MSADQKQFPHIRGLDPARQAALIAIVATLVATVDLDEDLRRRAEWLQWGLEGRQPGQEPNACWPTTSSRTALDDDVAKLAFVDDTGPLVPEIDWPASSRTALADEAGCGRRRAA